MVMYIYTATQFGRWLVIIKTYLENMVFMQIWLGIKLNYKAILL